MSGDAWPSEARIANRLQIDVKTVKRALPPLKLCGYIEVKKNGRHNTYRPMFDGPLNGDNLSPIDQMAPGDNLSGDRRQIVPSIGDKNGPLTSLRELHQDNRSKNTIIGPSERGRAREGCPREHGDPLASKPDDGGIHLMLIEELGSQVVDALHALDGGRPLKILTLQRRQRPLTPIEAVHARSLAAGELRGPRAGG